MMRKRILALALTMAITNSASIASEAKTIQTRTMTGTYYDYMCIETKDGNEWLLSDSQPWKNPYMKRKVVRFNGKRKVEYMPKFKSGQRVIVKFNTLGTRKVYDDEIISVKVIRKGN